MTFNKITVAIGPNTICLDRKIFDREYLDSTRESIYDSLNRALGILFGNITITHQYGYTNDNLHFIDVTYTIN